MRIREGELTKTCDDGGGGGVRGSMKVGMKKVDGLNFGFAIDSPYKAKRVQALLLHSSALLCKRGFPLISC